MKKVISLTLSKEVIGEVEHDAKTQFRSKSQVIDLILKRYYKLRKRGDRDGPVGDNEVIG